MEYTRQKQARYYILTGTVLFGIADSIAELNEIMTELAETKGEDAVPHARILGVLHDSVEENESFPFVKVPGKITFEEWSESDETESKFTIYEGRYRGTSYEYMEDMADFLLEKIEAGEITADEASEINIVKEPVLSGGIGFEQDSPTWELDLEGMTEEQIALIDAMGDTYLATRYIAKPAGGYISADRVQEEVDKRIEELVKEQQLVSLNRDLESYDDAVLMHAEAIRLMNRASKLMEAYRTRTEVKELAVKVEGDLLK